MATLITDRRMAKDLRAARAASGADRWDEVWEGVYFMPPMPNNEHQLIVSRFGSSLAPVIEAPGLGLVFVGCNVSDRESDWVENYRVPDVAVFLQSTTARNCGTHWWGGPDLVVEVLSEDDQSRAKIPFYEAVGVRELLLVDRAPWALELYHLQEDKLKQTARVTPGQADVLKGQVVPLAYRLKAGTPRPTIEIEHADSGQRWSV